MEFVDNQETGFVAKIKEFSRAHPLFIYSLKRIGSACITILLAVTITFLLLRTLDPAKIYGPYINKYPIEMRPIIQQQVLERMGLDLPIFEQLIRYYYQIIPIIPKSVCMRFELLETGLSCAEYQLKLIDFGTSFLYAKEVPISNIISSAMPWSFTVGALSLILQFGIGYPLGIFMAKYKDKWFDRFGNIYIVVVSSIPTLVYYFFIYYLFLGFGVEPAFDSSNPGSWLPVVLALGLMGSTGTAMWVRRFMVDELNADYVKFARAKGLPDNQIVFKHVLRNAVVPIVRTIPLAIAYTLLGAYFAETVFSVPGIGKLLITAIQMQDNALVQALVLIFAGISTIAYLVGDIVTVLFDPRISLTE
ncbi:MAG: ABC transporter permease [Bacilli bacterium]|nr:ABC transporter permease [Bacilli bacterium]